MPFDMQIEIIKRIRIESVIPFRSVSKQWKSLIDSSEFITNFTFRPQHTQHHNLLLAYQAALNYKKQIVLIVNNDNDNDNVEQKSNCFN